MGQWEKTEALSTLENIHIYLLTVFWLLNIGLFPIPNQRGTEKETETERMNYWSIKEAERTAFQEEMG